MISKRIKNNELTFYLVGEIDQLCAYKIRNYVDDEIDKFKGKYIVFNLEKVEFMDSTGIGILLGRYKKYAEQGKIFFVKNPNNSVDKVLRLSGIYQLMKRMEC